MRLKNTFESEDLRLVGPAAIAWAVSWLAIWEIWWVLILVLAFGLVLGLVSWQRGNLAGCILVLVAIGFGLAAGGRSLSMSLDPARAAAAKPAVVEVVGQVLVPSSPHQSLRLRLSEILVEYPQFSTAEVTVIGRAPPHLIRGTTVKISGRLSLLERKIFLRPLADPVVVQPAGPGDSAIEAVRDGLRRAAAALGPPISELVPALVLGDTSGVSTEVSEVFQDTGLTHLMAVSGANLSILLAFVLTISRTFPSRIRSIFSVVMTIIFIGLCHAEPSVLRAAAMGIVGLSALGFGRSAGTRNLALAILVLLAIDPWLAVSWGFALSVAATTGILTLSRRWMLVWEPVFGRTVSELIAIPMAAQLATQPLIVALSGTISVVGILANLLAAPLVAPATILGFLAAGFGWWLAPVATALAGLSGGCTQAIWWIAKYGSELPGAAWRMTPSPGVAIGVALGLVAVIVLAQKLANVWIFGGMLLVLAGLLTRPPIVLGWPPANWDLVACDVGQGDAWVFNAGPGAAVVIDTGPDPKLVRQCLDSLKIDTVPLLILTHPHADHLGGLAGVLPKTQELLVGPGVEIGWDTTIAAASTRYQVGRVAVTMIRAVPMPRVEIDPGTRNEGESAAENDASLLGVVEVGELSVIFAGDSEVSAQSAVLAQVPPVDVLLVPHHGSARQSPEFLAQTQAPVAIISVGAKNPYGHPTKTTLNRLATARVFRTDKNGAIAINKREGKIQVHVRNPR